MSEVVMHTTGQRNRIRRLERERDALLAALKIMESEKSDYMIRNKLGDPSKEPTNIMARAAIAACESREGETPCPPKAKNNDDGF